jgi:uncharacterized membrane protein YqjE
METAADHFGLSVASSRRVMSRLMTIGHNRLELLVVELQEERERLLHAILLALAGAVFGLLAGMVLTAAIALWLWPLSGVVVLLVLTMLYGPAAAWLYRRLTALLQDWKTLPATLDQLREDRAWMGTVST